MWIAFGAGLIVGCIIGIIITGLCLSAKDSGFPVGDYRGRGYGNRGGGRKKS